MKTSKRRSGTVQSVSLCNNSNNVCCYISLSLSESVFSTDDISLSETVI